MHACMHACMGPVPIACVMMWSVFVCVVRVRCMHARMQACLPMRTSTHSHYTRHTGYSAIHVFAHLFLVRMPNSEFPGQQNSRVNCPLSGGSSPLKDVNMLAPNPRHSTLLLPRKLAVCTRVLVHAFVQRRLHVFVQRRDKCPADDQGRPANLTSRAF